jgi:hypothetical protein
MFKMDSSTEPPADEFFRADEDEGPEPQKVRLPSIEALQRENLLLINAKLRDEASRSREPKPAPIEILSLQEILEQPDPVWLIEPWLEADSFAVLAGPSDTFKSFLALDWACSVASDKKWLRNPTKHGQVLYVYAEGGKGIAKRLNAWSVKRKAQPANFHGIPHAIDLSGERSVGALINRINAARPKLRPTLIVIDTLNRCFGGGNENDTKDMSAFIRGCDRLRSAFPGSTLLVIHHTGWEAAHERGNSSLRGALDTLLRIEQRVGDKIALGVAKQKNFEEDQKPLWLEAVKVPGTNSIVLDAAEPPVKAKEGDANDGKVLTALTNAYPKGLKPGELAAASGVNINTLKGVRRRLERAKKIREEDGRIFAILQKG